MSPDRVPPMKPETEPATALPRNFHEWPECMRRRYRRHALAIQFPSPALPKPSFAFSRR